MVVSCSYNKSKYAKFGVDYFNTFWVMGYIKDLYKNDGANDPVVTSSGIFFETDKLKKQINYEK